jgi:hypothetical protein
MITKNKEIDADFKSFKELAKKVPTEKLSAGIACTHYNIVSILH